MNSRIRINIPTEDSNLTESLQITIRREKWNVEIRDNLITVTSTKEYDVPSPGWSEGDFDLDRKVNDMIDAVVGHVRNATYIAYGLSLRWGYEAWYGSTHASGSLNMFPSIHQTGSSTKYSPELLPIMKSIFEDLGSSKLKPVIIMLNYWRRAEELDDLGFHAEAFLNFYKVLECLEVMDENSTVKKSFLDKFSPVRTVDGKTERIPMTKIKRKFTSRRSNGSLVSHIERSSKMLATSNFTQVNTNFMMYLMELTDVRNGYNVAHALAYYNKFDTYRGVGQHSDEFEYVIQDLWNVREMSKLLILNYAYPGKYKFDWREREWLFATEVKL